jgi:hypothetical protein
MNRRHCRSIQFLFLLFLENMTNWSDAFFMRRLTVAEFQSEFSTFDEPVIVEQALEWKECQAWWNHIQLRSKDENVIMECGSTSFNQTSLTNAFQCAKTQSSHSHPVYVTSSPESPCSIDQLPFYDFVHSIFGDFLEDCMPLISYHIPITDSLIIAGEGSSSRVQRYPFTTVCLGLAGNSLWRILPPNQLWKTTPKFRTSWDEFDVPFGDNVMDNNVGGLFGLRHNDVERPDDEEELTFMDDDKYLYYQHLAEDFMLIRPSLSMNENWRSTVLLDGDVLVIPPNWWFQSYNMDLSITLMSQKCHDLYTFIQNVIHQTGINVPSRLLQRTEFHNLDDTKESIDELFDLLYQQYKDQKYLD